MQPLVDGQPVRVSSDGTSLPLPGAPRSLGERALAFVRSDNPISRRAKAALKRLYRAEMPPTPLHRALAVERFWRRLLLRQLKRALYEQPILRTLCVASGRDLLLDPGTGIPV